MSDFEEKLKRRIVDAEQGFGKFLPKEEGFQKLLWESMNYSFLAGGKRLRPIFMHETFKLFGGNNEDLVRPFMAAIEMIHTYSLVHDDLPAMDNDDYRRGRLTTHKVYGEDMAVLAGDGLLNYAFETAVKAFESGRDCLRIGEALRVLAAKAGGHGMIGGQVVDVSMSGKPLDRQLLDFIYEKKTSALIEAAMMIGAVLAGADEEQILKIEKIARKVGLAFQIQDDILDIVGDASTIGKPVHSDEKNEKMTYAVLLGEEQAKQMAWNYSKEAIEQLQKISNRDSENGFFLQELITYLMDRNK